MSMQDTSVPHVSVLKKCFDDRIYEYKKPHESSDSQNRLHVESDF